MEKKAISFLVVFSVFFVLTGAVHALQLCTKDQALTQTLGSGAKITTETKELSGQKLVNVKQKLGGSLTYHKAGEKAAETGAKVSVDFNFASKDGKKTGAAFMDTEPGKWGPIDLMIGLNPQGSVTKVVVMCHSEKRGQPISRGSWLSQFTGKNSNSPLTVGKDITGVSGATISSSASAFAVKKAVTLYEALYLNK